MAEKTTRGNLQTQLCSLIVPQEILECFEVTLVQQRATDITIELLEKESNIPLEVKGKQVVLNGYMNPLELQCFPIQAKSCYLRLIRRRWKEKETQGNVSYHNQYDFAAPGTKATKSFGAFLKEHL